ncbi:hypothetical protein Catovirus_1_235 [Catovirus CTV1]|uniref:Uncharacterized protein n=1 Tax=Catovirus CTV1 TaxID=1977631 RepID=A0A1V0S901_9VIRU|nr:hypothetical protein Catovirus_1_235 [Catovirus CTV1]
MSSTTVTFDDIQNDNNLKSNFLQIVLVKDNIRKIIYYPNILMVILSKHQYINTINSNHFEKQNTYEIKLSLYEEINDSINFLKDFYNYYFVQSEPIYIDFSKEYKKILFSTRYDVDHSKLYNLRLNPNKTKTDLILCKSKKANIIVQSKFNYEDNLHDILFPIFINLLKKVPNVLYTTLQFLFNQIGLDTLDGKYIEELKLLTNSKKVKLSDKSSYKIFILATCDSFRFNGNTEVKFRFNKLNDKEYFLQTLDNDNWKNYFDEPIDITKHKNILFDDIPYIY